MCVPTRIEVSVTPGVSALPPVLLSPSPEQPATTRTRAARTANPAGRFMSGPSCELLSEGGDAAGGGEHHENQDDAEDGERQVAFEALRDGRGDVDAVGQRMGGGGQDDQQQSAPDR